MSQKARALLIGFIGPALQALGITWDLLEHAVFERSEIAHLTLTHIISGPAHLVMFTGFALSLVCIPIALEVAAARPEELEAAPFQTPAQEPYAPGLEAVEARK